eukprot:jgi/Hompol1/4525/HPOL_003687-RA
MYPAAFHGPGGEGRQFALGLSLAGSAGDEHVLDTACTYGTLRYDAASRRLAKKDEPAVSAIVSDPLAPRSICDVLHMKTASWRQEPDHNKVKVPRHVPGHPQSGQLSSASRAAPSINTRYSANSEWGRATHVLVQAPTTSHFYQAEQDRLQNLPFVDDEQISKRTNYKLKLQKYVRDKNVDTVSGLLHPI